MSLPGTCGGTNGGYNCFLEYLSKFGASAIPKNCTCQQAAHNQRLCKCNVVCGRTK